MRPEREFAFLLDDAVNALDQSQGVPPLAPGLEKDALRLAPLLETARRLRQAASPTPPFGAAGASRARMMQVLIEKERAAKQHRANLLEDLGQGLRKGAHGKGIILGVLALVFAFIFLSTLAVASVESLPGSWLYPAKLSLQDARIGLTFDPAARQALIDLTHQSRVQDLQAAVALNRLTTAEAQATITALPTPQPTATQVKPPD